MKRIIIFVIALIIIILMGLSVLATEDTGLISKYDLLEMYHFEEPQYVDSFIREYQITREYAEAVDMVPLYKSYTRSIAIAENDFSYLIKTPDLIHEKTLNKEDIVKVLWFKNPGSRINAYLYDLEAGILYYDDYNILSNISKANKKQLSVSECAAILSALDDNGVAGWDPYYPSTVDYNSTAWFAWIMAIEYKDGSIFQVSGEGSYADNFPKTYDNVAEVLEGFGD